MGTRSIRVWKRLGKSLILVSILVMLASTALWYRYAQTRPHTAQPGEGRVYGLNTQGYVVYLTGGERLGLYGLELAAVSCFLGAVAIYVMLKRRGYEE